MAKERESSTNGGERRTTTPVADSVSLAVPHDPALRSTPEVGETKSAQLD